MVCDVEDEKATRINSPEVALKYIADVRSKRIVVGNLVRLAVERHVQDLKASKDPAFPFYFDEVAAASGIEWFSLLEHFEAEWAGKCFELDGWQAFIQWCTYGWKRKEGDFRRFKYAYVEIARKNGKSHIGAGNGLYLLVADGENAAQVFSAATKREQAKLVFNQACAFVDASPHLRGYVDAKKSAITVPSTYSSFKTRGQDSRTEDGLSVSGAILDEYFAHPADNGMFNVLNSSTGARKQPLFWIITTAGADEESPCQAVHDLAVNVLEGKENFRADSWFFFVACLDKDDDPWDEKNWIKPNPGLERKDNSTLLNDLRTEAATAKNLVSVRNEFLQKRLNIWVQSSVAWLDVQKWDSLYRPFDSKEWENAEVFGGLDLATTYDYIAFILLYKLGKKFYVRPEFWIPRATATLRTKTDHVPCLDWIEEEWLNATEGDVTDFDVVENRVAEVGKELNIRGIAFDGTRFAPQLTQHLQDNHGLPMLKFGQGFLGYSRPCKFLDELIRSGDLSHDGNKVMRWMVGNVAIKTNSVTGDILPKKPEDKSIKKIDGVTALAMALGVASQTPEDDFYIGK